MQEAGRSEGIVAEERTATEEAEKINGSSREEISRSDPKCASLQQDLEAEIFETAEATKDVSF